MQANSADENRDTTLKIFQSVWVGCAAVRKDWKGNGGFNPLSPKSDQSQFSPNNIDT